MRRAYVETHVDLPEAVALALKWAGATATISVPNTACVDANPWLRELGLPITSPSAKSKHHAPASGTVIAFDLGMPGVLEVDRLPSVDGMVAIRAHGPDRYAPGVLDYRPWITAYDVEHLGGEVIAPLDAPSPQVRAAIEGMTSIAIRNQGLIDRRDRSTVIEGLMFLQRNNIQLDPDVVMVEALRNHWGGDGAEKVRQTVIDLNQGKKLSYTGGRLRPAFMDEWLHAG